MCPKSSAQPLTKQLPPGHLESDLESRSARSCLSCPGRRERGGLTESGCKFFSTQKRLKFQGPYTLLSPGDSAGRKRSVGALSLPTQSTAVRKRTRVNRKGVLDCEHRLQSTVQRNFQHPMGTYLSEERLGLFGRRTLVMTSSPWWVNFWQLSRKRKAF